MPSLSELRKKIKGVSSTRQITKAMKMVSAAKLRRAQENVVAARPYAKKLGEVLQSLAGNHIEEVIGILNGTTNYILTKMSQEGRERLLERREPGGHPENRNLVRAARAGRTRAGSRPARR